MRWKIFLLVLLIALNIASAAEITRTDIPDFSWEQGTNLNNALELNDYFSSTSELRYNYELDPQTSSISPVSIEISNDNTGEVSFKSSSDSSFAGEKYITFIAYESTNQSNNLTSKVVMLNVTKKTTSFQTPSNLSIKSFTPSSTNVKINVWDIQVFEITLDTTENVSVSWYVNNEIEQEGSERKFSYTADTIGTISIKVKVKSGAKSVDNEWTLTVSEKASPKEELKGSSSFVQDEPACGNGIKEADENCETCPQDVSCATNAVCTNGICVPKEQKSSSLLKMLMIILITIIILGGLGIGIFFMYKKGLFNKFKKKELPTEEKKILPTKKLDISILKNYLQENLKKGYTIENLKKAALGRGWTLEDIKKALPESKIEPLKRYIKENLKKGYTKQQIEQVSLKTGWTKEQIDQAFAEIKNDNPTRDISDNRKIP